MKKVLLITATLLLALALSPNASFSQKTLGVWGGSDSIAVACDSNWCGNVYVWPTGTKSSRAYLWIENLGSAGDLGVAINGDTTALVGAFGKFLRIGPSGDRTYAVQGMTIRIRALRKGTTVPFRFSILKQ